MADKKQNLTRLAETVKAKKFINQYVNEHGVMPAVEAVTSAKTLTPAEEADIDNQIKVDNLINRACATKVTGVWDYIKDEASWNASYQNGALKDYYVWADQVNAPYKEDLWNTVENRAARLSDAKKDPETGEYLLDENGSYIYENCERCWKGAFNAPGAQYPWCAVKFEPFYGIIKFEHEGTEVYPWGEDFRKFKRTFGIASIPGEFNKPEWKSDINGNTTFDPSKLVVTRFVEE